MPSVVLLTTTATTAIAWSVRISEFVKKTPPGRNSFLNAIVSYSELISQLIAKRHKRISLAIDCGEIEAISGGEVVALNQSTFLDAVIEYKCQYGMKLQGNPVRKCLSNGLWSGTLPACKGEDNNFHLLIDSQLIKSILVIDCGWPENGTHIQISLTENTTKIGSIAEYSCMSGFTLLGSNLRHCSPNGKWVPQPPICYGIVRFFW